MLNLEGFQAVVFIIASQPKLVTNWLEATGSNHKVIIAFFWFQSQFGFQKVELAK